MPFRPGGAYASLAAELPYPFNQSLVFGGLDHKISAGQNLRVRVVYEHARQENFRTGGLGDLSSGMNLNRNNFNATATYSATFANGGLNQLSTQVGRRQFTEPNNSPALAEYFSSGNTLQTGANPVGDQNDTNNTVEFRDAFYKHVGSGRWAQDLKAGGAFQWVRDDWNFPIYPRNLMIYVTDTRALPLLYVNATGAG